MALPGPQCAGHTALAAADSATAGGNHWFRYRCGAGTPEAAVTHRSRDFICEQYEISTAAHARMPFYVLRPTTGTRVRQDAQGRRPLVVACSGHGSGAKEVVGLSPDGSPRPMPDGYQQDFAVALCRQGFLVAVPEIAGFGERQSDFSSLAADNSPVPSTCKYLSALAWHLGGSVVGMRVRDLRRMLDHVVTMPQVDPGRIGFMGISGGGMLALFGSALDTRFRAVVVSGYFSTFKG